MSDSRLILLEGTAEVGMLLTDSFRSSGEGFLNSLDLTFFGLRVNLSADIYSSGASVGVLTTSSIGIGFSSVGLLSRSKMSGALLGVVRLFEDFLSLNNSLLRLVILYYNGLPEFWSSLREAHLSLLTPLSVVLTVFFNLFIFKLEPVSGFIPLINLLILFLGLKLVDWHISRSRVDSKD